MSRKALTAEQIALLASGAPAEAAAAAQAATQAEATAAATAATAATPGVAAPAAATAAPAEAAAAPAAAPAAAAAPSADVLTFLQGQITAKDASLLAANVEITGLKAKIADTDASLAGLKTIAAKSITNMRVALGASATDLSALTATELLAQHSAASKDFETKFVAGGVAAVDAAQAPKGNPAVDPTQLARLETFLG